MSNTNFIYMAGLMDGEGTVGITYNNNKVFRSPYISITSTTPEIIHWLRETFGGQVCIQKVYQDHHKKSWSWRVRSIEQIKPLLRGILPYMKEPEKIRRANLLLNEYSEVTVRNGKYTTDQLRKKMAFEEAFLIP